MSVTNYATIATFWTVKSQEAYRLSRANRIINTKKIHLLLGVKTLGCFLWKQGGEEWKQLGLRIWLSPEAPLSMAQLCATLCTGWWWWRQSVHYYFNLILNTGMFQHIVTINV